MIKKICLNCLAIVLLVLILLHCYNKLGYKHVYNLIRLDYKTARHTHFKSIEDRNVIKLGMSYMYLRYIKENTPENAVIYLPSATVFMMDGYGDKFCNPHCSSKLWAIRTIYPRKIVSATEYDIQGAVPPLTHVFVVNGQGRELLDYEIPENVSYEIYPVRMEDTCR